jgi:hypothetical protein
VPGQPLTGQGSLFLDKRLEISNLDLIKDLDRINKLEIDFSIFRIVIK